jgi:microcystin-dependent protein
MAFGSVIHPPFGQTQVMLVLAPVGAVLPYAGPADDAGTQNELAQQGWLFCDGSEIPKLQFPDLYRAIGDAYGTASTDGSFLLPDYRGLFLRGVDGGRGVDPDSGIRTGSGPNQTGNAGDAVGSYEACQFQEHEHQYTPQTVPGPFQPGGTNAVVQTLQSTTTAVVCEAGTADSTQCFGKETRPVNIYVNFLIKALPYRVIETVPAVEIVPGSWRNLPR